MSGIIGHTLYAELALREAVQQKHRWAGVMQAHRASFHAGAYIGSDIQVMPEAVCVDTGKEVGFGTVPLERSPITGGAVRQFRLVTPDGPLTATRVHERFYGRAHLVFGWTQAEKELRVPWDHLPEYFAAVIADLDSKVERALAYTLGWIVHVVGDSLLHRHIGFRLVDFGMALKALDAVFFDIFGLKFAVGDFAQSNNRVFIPVAVHQRLGAARQLAGTVRRQKHQIETVRNLVDTIFNGYARHRGSYNMQNLRNPGY